MNKYNITLLGLYNWTKEIFEKLGWMTLAHNEKDTKTLNAYKTNIMNLHKHILIKIDYLKKQNREKSNVQIFLQIHDLEILESNIMTLKKYVEKLIKEKSPSLLKVKKDSKKKKIKKDKEQKGGA
jgi:hypothetical protein